MSKTSLKTTVEWKAIPYFTGVPTLVSQAFLVSLNIQGWGNVQFRNILIK